ncbi:MAG: hypothetical protein HY689_03495 [Chloroflexi bacterium]|nr:hypothetical protein [Chloroflexota bacterium]
MEREIRLVTATSDELRQVIGQQRATIAQLLATKQRLEAQVERKRPPRPN